MSRASGKLLIVEDEFVIAQDLRRIITNLGFPVMGMAKSAKEALKKIEDERPDLVLMDINIIGEVNGIELAKEIEDRFKIPYIYVTSYSDTDTLKQINATNPLGYILKPFDQRDIRVALEIGFTKLKQGEGSHPVQPKGATPNPTQQITGESAAIKNAIKKVQQVAKTDVTVLIHGETGTGKELFMQVVHSLSKRSENDIVKVNCAALPAELIESVLFGHEKGSFTGASEKRIGKFELADAGTIFLDEIGELPLTSQSKLLRCLQEKEIETIGGSQPKKVDVRVVAATNRNLAQEVEKGNFRADLFYRLNVFPVYVPPLRDRKEDIPLLVNHFLKDVSKELDKDLKAVGKETLKAFRNHHWPGNVRELRHMIERAAIMAETSIIDIDSSDLEQNHSLEFQEEFELKSLEEAERERIVKTLKLCSWRVRGPGGAAEILKIHPNTLDFKIKKMNIKKWME